MRRDWLALALGVLGVAGCGGNVDIWSHLPDDGQGVGGSTARGGSDGWSSGGLGGVIGRSGFGGAPAAAGRLSIGGAPARDPAAGGQGSPPRIEGWLVVDVDYPFSRRGLTLIAADGSCEVELSRVKEQHRHPAVSRDGRYLAYASNQSGTFQIHIRTLATGEIRQVTALDAGASYPAWSPDGSHLVLVEGDVEGTAGASVLLLTLETGAIRRIYNSTSYLSSLVSAFVDDDRVVIGNGQRLLSLGLSDGFATELVRDSNPVATMPAVSPDGTRVVFSGQCGTDGPSLFIAQADGSGGDPCESMLDPGSPRAAAPDWGPFDVIAAEAADSILLLPADGSAAVGTLTSAFGRAHNPAWAPADFSIPCR